MFMEQTLTLVQEQRKVQPTEVEHVFGLEEFIVSKTNLQGHITYANEVFCRVSGFTREELIGAPHVLVRHPSMPRCVFKLLWDTIQDGREIFAYIKNMCRNGDHYWVLAHVTPTFDRAGKTVGYHSNRRSPDRQAVQFFEKMYGLLLTIEETHTDRRAGLDASYQELLHILNNEGKSYDELVFSHTRI